MKTNHFCCTVQFDEENPFFLTMAENENINMHFFEGVEKLLEIWFAPNQLNNNADLRKIPRLVNSHIKFMRIKMISFKKPQNRFYFFCQSITKTLLKLISFPFSFNSKHFYIIFSSNFIELCFCISE